MCEGILFVVKVGSNSLSVKKRLQQKGTVSRPPLFFFLWTPLIIANLSLPPRIQYGVNSGGGPVFLGTSGFLLS